VEMVERIYSKGGNGYVVSVGYAGYLSDDSFSQEGIDYIELLLSIVDEARAFAAEELLETYNDVWSENEVTITSEEFKKNLELSFMEILDEPNSADLYFSDNDMFAGHSVVVLVKGATLRYARLLG